jgi:hypothetical protein
MQQPRGRVAAFLLFACAYYVGYAFLFAPKVGEYLEDVRRHFGRWLPW